ncbi:MAG: hypothetical protein ACHP7N_18950, partial [Caulobacterales bacterium]
MSAATTSGAGAGGPGQVRQAPRRPSMAEIMRAQADPAAARRLNEEMTQNAYQQQGAASGSASHTLILQLGSARKPSGDPTAEHDPPPGLGAGPMLPLVTPLQQPAHEEAAPGPPPQMQQMQGRMLIFWGCGEHAGPGQPLVIDMSTLSQGGGKLGELMRSLAITPMQPPSPARNATYGEWPNAQANTSVPADGSLQGEHTIKGNYSPEIRFSLAADQDFLPPIQITSNQKNPSGSAALGWRHVDGAQGYLITVSGAQSPGQIVMWTSSAVEASGFALPEYLSDGEIARLVGSHVLLPASETSCTVPAEVTAAVGMGSYRMVAYGGETNISYPPRPPAPQPWDIAWQVKIRYRAATGGVLGMDMNSMMGGQGQGGPGAPPPSQPQPRPRNPFNPFGG